MQSTVALSCPRRLLFARTHQPAFPARAPFLANHSRSKFKRTMPAATEVGRGGATADHKAPERNEVEAETPHAAYHYDDDTKRRVFEG